VGSNPINRTIHNLKDSYGGLFNYLLIYSAINGIICTVKGACPQMRLFDYSFLKDKPIPANTVNLLTTVEKLTIDRKIMVESYPKLFEELTKVAIVQSIISSNAIEGIITNDDRIKGLLNGTVSPINHNENEILGYKDVINLIHINYQDYSFSEEQVLFFHRLLLSYERPPYAGKYKTNDNVIMEISADGMRSVRFRPTPAKETQAAMEQMILAYMDARDDSSIHQLLLIPCIILDFLSIHPFSDGNGRMSRLISLLLLYKNGFNIGKYISFENQINLYKKEYYQSLKLSSEDWSHGRNDYYPFINYFLVTLIRCFNELDKRVSILAPKVTNKKERIKTTIEKSLVPLSRKELQELWPDIALDTIKKVLIELQNDGYIQKIGNFKNAKYKKQ
jgi:Fic family protein